MPVFLWGLQSGWLGSAIAQHNYMTDPSIQTWTPRFGWVPLAGSTSYVFSHTATGRIQHVPIALLGGDTWKLAFGVSWTLPRVLFPFVDFNLHPFAVISSIRSDQSLSRVQLFVTPWIVVGQASLSITNSWSSLRLTSIESVIPSSHGYKKKKKDFMINLISASFSSHLSFKQNNSSPFVTLL